jgi:hypothetical protein
LSPNVAGLQQPNADGRVKLELLERHEIRASTMLRSAALRFTAEGRLLGFDTGDWSMLLGGFLVAGLLTLMI